jgi:ribosomal protein S18 acetylase RimI-like enzyme
MIGKVGNINNIDGLQIYLFDNTKIGELYLINFELSLDVHKKNYTLLQSIDDPFLNNNNSLFLYSLKIEKDFRGLGHSKTLIEESIKELFKYNLEYLFLICKTNNKIAQNLYSKYGFVKYITDKEDDLLYMKNPHF